MFTVKASAKLNLTLEVLAKRPDGFHEIRSVFQTIGLFDTVRFEDGDDIVFECDMTGWSAEASLVKRATALIREVTGCLKGAVIKIEKRIPLMSGLGGDSSDAAAVLRGLDELWGLNLPPERLLKMAAQIGSDVAFFRYGGTALVGGRGEVVTPLPSLRDMWVVLVVPDVPGEPGKTGRMYQSLKPAHFTDGKITERFIESLKEDREFQSSMLFNVFENIAFADFNISRVYVEHLIKLGAPHVHLAGSGPALFTMSQDKAKAEDLYARCKAQGMAAYLVKTI